MHKSKIRYVPFEVIVTVPFGDAQSVRSVATSVVIVGASLIVIVTVLAGDTQEPIDSVT